MKRLEVSINTKGFPSFVSPRPRRQKHLPVIFLNVIHVQCLHVLPTDAKAIHIILACAGMRVILYEFLAEEARQVIFVGRGQKFSLFVWGVVVGETGRLLEYAALVAG